jgi:outer membrane receptor protein involved in Fe transport
MVYALANKGFRIGGPNISINLSLCAADLAQLGLTNAPTQFAPDSVWNYELGGKTDWLDHRLRINLAAYYMKWTNIQEFTNMMCGYGFTSNIATAKSQGVELESKGVLSDYWAAGGTFSFNKANYTSSLSGAGIVNGDRLESAPKTTGSFFLEFNHPTPGLKEWELSARGEYVYTGNMQYAYPRQNPTFPFVPSYSIVNGRLALTKSSLSVSLFGNNLLNRVNLNYLNSFPYNHLDLFQAGALPPRTIGLAIDKRF